MGTFKSIGKVWRNWKILKIQNTGKIEKKRIFLTVEFLKMEKI